MEIVYLSMKELRLIYTNSDIAQSADISLGWLQLDNQLNDCQYPVVLQPVPVSKENQGGQVPSIQATAIVLKDSCEILFQTKN